jgi:hypothetical protein
MSYLKYKFIGKTPEIDAARRSTSDWYANLAQLSQLLFILGIPLSKFAIAILSRLFRSSSISNHNVKKASQEGKAPRQSYTIQDIESILGREVIKGYGTYEQWIFGLCWAAWLGFLCIKDTVPGA